MRIQKLNENQLKDMADIAKKKQKGLSPFCYLNPDAGDVEKGIEVFNGSMGSDGGGMAMGESVDDYDTESEKYELFKKIQMINPNADYKNYEKKSVRQMLAILNTYREKSRNKIVEVPTIPKYNKKEKYTISDIYQDKDNGDFMINGLPISFETEEEAVLFMRELNTYD